MSNPQKAQQTTQAPRQPEADLESLRGEVAILRKAIGSLAWLMLEPPMRSRCECGSISCRTVTATANNATEGAVSVAQQTFKLCDECSPPQGWTEARRVELAPDYREVIRIANKLCLQQR